MILELTNGKSANVARSPCFFHFCWLLQYRINEKWGPSSLAHRISNRMSSKGGWAAELRNAGGGGTLWETRSSASAAVREGRVAVADTPGLAIRSDQRYELTGETAPERQHRGNSAGETAPGRQHRGDSTGETAPGAGSCRELAV